MKISFGFCGYECINGRYATSVDLYFYTVLDFVQAHKENKDLRGCKRTAYNERPARITPTRRSGRNR